MCVCVCVIQKRTLLTDNLQPRAGPLPRGGEVLILRGPGAHAHLDGAWDEGLVAEACRWVVCGRVYGVLRGTHVGHPYKTHHGTTLYLVDEIYSGVDMICNEK